MRQSSADSTHSPVFSPCTEREAIYFAEEMGLMFEKVGFPRMAGRIFGWLLISDPPQQTSQDLAHILQASKGSISSMTRLLIQIGLIERTSIPGERRDYFQIRPNAWTQLAEQRLAQIATFRRLAERGLDLLSDAPPTLKQRLQEMHDVHAFWEQELPQLNQRWEREWQGRPGRA
ncbi:MAG: MarR family transcriptional regulator [Synechococcales bacterium]|nr:MarR family transcriptional regulator [Synechococcales bacterium]